MDEFRTVARLWPSGTELDLGTDSNVLTLTPPDSANFSRIAPPFVTSADGTQNYEFLFWNTGRHVTNKRKVIWIFSVFGWGIWTATRWYGTPPTGPNGGHPRVRADSFSIHGDGTLSPTTPIDGAASTYAAGAWPYSGDDHMIDTVPGAATVVAHDHSGAYDFGGWTELIWGGDPSGDFVETDSGTTGSFGSSSFYTPVSAGSAPFHAAQSSTHDLVASYVPEPVSIPSHPHFGQIDWGDVLGSVGAKIPQNVDPAPIDLIRLAALEELVLRAQPAAAAGTDFERLVKDAPQMSDAELKRSIQSVRTTLDLGKSAISAMDAQLNQREG